MAAPRQVRPVARYVTLTNYDAAALPFTATAFVSESTGGFRLYHYLPGQDTANRRVVKPMACPVSPERFVGSDPSLRAMLPPLAGRRVVDLGCGFGWFCRWAAGQGAAW